ncbi:hypothetical protein [Streptomyces sp. NBC_01718]|uniref:hypothetical protein n=1 Tax=Streptomyces sp. NBC_01718 TaxID=2975919 RepID=UPI00352F05F1
MYSPNLSDEGKGVTLAEFQRLVLEAVELYSDRAQLARQFAVEWRRRRCLAEFRGRFGGSDGS